MTILFLALLVLLTIFLPVRSVAGGATELRPPEQVAKPAPVSRPIASATPITPGKGAFHGPLEPIGGEEKSPLDQTTAGNIESPSCYVADLNAPCVPMPYEMAVDAYAVIQCESKHNPRAVSKTDDWGLWQLNRIHEARANQMGYQWNDMLEIGPNTDVAISIWEEQGFGPWSCRP